MKTQKALSTLLIAMLLTACAPTTYYQVYKTASTDKLVLKNNLLLYEDENCKVSYNLWGEGGNIGFQFYNKTDKNIFLNLEESFFIQNGISNNYYKNRVFTNSSSSGTTASRGSSKSISVVGINYLDLIQTNRITATNTVGILSSSGYSVSYNEEKVVCIPSKTSKNIAEYTVNKSLYRDCDLLKYPTKKQIKAKTFTKEESPLIFSNRLTYTLGQRDNIINFENEFYITEISNYPEKEIIEVQYNEYCGQKKTTSSKYFKIFSADKFYIKYSKGIDSWKH